MTDEKQALAEEQKPLDKMTVKELRDLAKESDITGISGMKKDELLAAIKGTSGGADATAETGAPKAKAPKAANKKASSGPKAPKTSAKDCKAEINSLRKELVASKEDGDKAQFNTLRRRISLLKKKSRKFKKAV
nr:Rho termination factor N-terminal domain-containing protein [Desulfobulbaceae bacterium]